MITGFHNSFVKNRRVIFVILFACAVITCGVFANEFDHRVLREQFGNSRQWTRTRHDKLYAVHFPGRDLGWAVGKFGTILHTVDGGKTWTRQHSGTTRPLTSVSFPDNRSGFIVGDGTILTTTNGGASWQAKVPGTRDHLLEVHATTANSAAVVGAFGTILSTDDGGQTWTRERIDWRAILASVIRETGDVEPNLNTVYFANEKQGWVAGEFGLILRTDDGGRTWKLQRASGNSPQITAIRFQDPFTGWAVGQKGTLLKTTDGGRIWEPTVAEFSQDFYGLALSSAGLVIVGSNGILKSLDNGIHWHRVDSIAPNSWFGVAINGRTAQAAGQFGVLKTIHLGQNSQTSN